MPISVPQTTTIIITSMERAVKNQILSLNCISAENTRNFNTDADLNADLNADLDTTEPFIDIAITDGISINLTDAPIHITDLTEVKNSSCIYFLICCVKGFDNKNTPNTESNMPIANISANINANSIKNISAANGICIIDSGICIIDND